MQYLYVSKVRNPGTVYILPSYPAYKGWSDRLLRERQKYDATHDCFGVGNLVTLKDKPDVRIHVVIIKYFIVISKHNVYINCNMFREVQSPQMQLLQTKN